MVLFEVGFTEYRQGFQRLLGAEMSEKLDDLSVRTLALQRESRESDGSVGCCCGLPMVTLGAAGCAGIPISC